MWYEWSLINTLQSDTFSRMLSQCWTHTKAAVKVPSQSVLIDNTCGCFVLILIQTSKGSLTVWLTYSKLYSSFGYRNNLLTIFESHNVHSIEWVNHGKTKVEPCAVTLCKWLQFIPAPGVLLVRRPGMFECLHYSLLLVICRTWIKEIILARKNSVIV